MRDSVQWQLLFGSLGAQMRFIEENELRESVRDYLAGNEEELATILRRRDLITEQQKEILTALVESSLEQSSQSIGGLSVSQSTINGVADTNAAPTGKVGSTIRIVEERGVGGLGIVSVGRDDFLNRDVAVKHIRPDRNDKGAYLNQFLHEARITAGLDHPGVVPVHGMGFDEEGRPFYSMQLVRGKSLAETVGNNCPDDSQLRRLLRHFIDACHAIHFAHEQGVIHRDIKPANIMIGSCGETYVVDWGLAIRLEDEPTERSPAKNDKKPSGTPAYMSPEQAAGRRDLGQESDVYGLGATLYYICTGRPPVQGESVTDVLEKAKAGKWNSPRVNNPQMPKPVASIIRRALATEPSDRFNTVAQMIDEIEMFLSGDRVACHRESLGEKLMRTSRKYRVATGVAMLATLLLSIGLGVSLVAVDSKRKLAEAEQVR
ncbi:MAG: serine/threonine-protein kinase, partial [Planctomycetota bacterium]